MTTSPPMIAGSTFTSSATSLPVTDFSAVLRASRFVSLSCFGDGDLGGHLALELAPPARGRRGSCRATANSRRLAVRTCRKFAAMPAMPALSSTAASALACSSAENTGLRTSRFRSALSAQHGVESVEIGLDRVDGFLVARQLEQGRCITAGHSRNGRIFSSHRRALFSCQTRKGKTVATMRRLAIQALGIQAGLRFSTGTRGTGIVKIAALLT